MFEVTVVIKRIVMKIYKEVRYKEIKKGDNNKEILS